MFFCFNDTATTEIYTLSLHDALPICLERREAEHLLHVKREHQEHREQHRAHDETGDVRRGKRLRSEEHTSELQSLTNLVCRLLLEKKNQIYHYEIQY